MEGSRGHSRRMSQDQREFVFVLKAHYIFFFYPGTCQGQVFGIDLLLSIKLTVRVRQSEWRGRESRSLLMVPCKWG